MKDLREKQLDNKQEEAMQLLRKQNEGLWEQNNKMREMIAAYQTQEIITNQNLFNQWAMKKLESLSEGINQLGEALSSEESEQEEEQEEEEVKPQPTPIKKVSAIKRIADSVSQYGNNLQRSIKEADPDNLI